MPNLGHPLHLQFPRFYRQYRHQIPRSLSESERPMHYNYNNFCHVKIDNFVDDAPIAAAPPFWCQFLSVRGKERALQWS
jgi:hypothetical protein